MLVRKMRVFDEMVTYYIHTLWSVYVHYLYVCLGVYFMHSITRCPASLVVKVVALYKHRVVAHAADPDISSLAVKDDTFTNV